LLQRLGQAGVTLHVAHRLDVPDDLGSPATLRPVFGGPDLEIAPALLVWHQQRVVDDRLQRVLPPADGVTVIGDGVTPRRISHAIAEGYRFGATV